MSNTKFQNTPLEVFAGNDESFNFTATDPDSGEASNLAAYTITATCRRREGDTAAVFEIAIPNTAPSNFAAGIVVLAIPAATSLTMRGGYVYEIRAVRTGSKITIAAGTINAMPTVAK